MHVLSPALYEHERFKDLPRIDCAKAQAQMDALVARARGEEPSYPGLAHKYEGGGFSRGAGQEHPRHAPAALTGMQREELFKELLDADPRDRPAARTSSRNESIAARRSSRPS